MAKAKIIGIKKVANTNAKTGKNFKIGLLAWGNTVSNTRGLSLATKFVQSDLEAPIEFSRVAKSKRIVPVIDFNHGRNNKLFLAISKHNNLEKAAKEFLKKEGINASRVCIVDAKNSLQSERMAAFEPISKNIYEFCKKNKLDAVIFNGLGRKWKDSGLNENFSVDSAGRYLESLSGKTQKSAIDYLKSIHKNISSPFLDQFRASIGVKSKSKSAAKMVKIN